MKSMCPRCRADERDQDGFCSACGHTSVRPIELTDLWADEPPQDRLATSIADDTGIGFHSVRAILDGPDMGDE